MAIMSLRCPLCGLLYPAHHDHMCPQLPPMPQPDVVIPTITLPDPPPAPAFDFSSSPPVDWPQRLTFRRHVFLAALTGIMSAGSYHDRDDAVKRAWALADIALRTE